MTSPKNLLIALLALTSLGGAFLAWQQYGELVELRAAALNRDERTDLQKRIADLERRNRDLQASRTAGSPLDSENALADAAGERTSEERGRRERGPGDGRGRGDDMRQQFTALRELMAKPEVQAMIGAQQRAAVDARYAALFKNLNLSPEQTEKLRTLLAERGNVRRDVEDAARAQGIDPRDNPEAFRKLFADAQNDISASIRATIGEQGYAQLQNYEQTLPQRNLVDTLQQRLASSSMPLTSAQSEQLVQILAANAPQRTAGASGTGITVTTTAGATTDSFGPPGRGPGGPGGFGGPEMGRMLGGFGGPPVGGGFGGPVATVTPAAVAQAQTVLAPPQVAALQQIQQQQQTQQQLQQLIHDTLSAAGATRSGSAPASGGSGSAPSGTPSRKRGGE